nr:hypothetical protein [Vibrio sp. 03_296]
MKTIKIASITAMLGFATLSFNASAADNKTVSVTQISSQFAFELVQEAVNQCSAEATSVCNCC